MNEATGYFLGLAALTIFYGAIIFWRVSQIQEKIIAIIQHQVKIAYQTDPFDLMFRGLNGIPTDEKGDYCRADIERLIIEVREECKVKP
jgi:hypothetical protein